MDIDECPRCGHKKNKLIKETQVRPSYDEAIGLVPTKQLLCKKCGLVFETAKKIPSKRV
jgi:rubredoxin